MARLASSTPPTGIVARDVELVPAGIRIGGRVVPLRAGSVHYWRLDPRDFRACLQAVRDLGIALVDVYVPWAVHEVAPGVLELGATDPQRDIGAFLRLAHELGLYAIVRPGPHINAELTHFGIPERIVWDPNCQARSPSGNPVLLPMVPRAFPVPSYASEAFLDEVARYFRALAPVLAPLLYPAGPVVLLQIDNEGALYFRDGAYDQDYHPDAIALYRAFVRDKYKTLEHLRDAYGMSSGVSDATVEPRFATLEPPRRFDATRTDDLARHLDWSELHEHLLATALERFARALSEAGIGGLPTTHNLPMGQEATPLNAARMTRAVDLVGLDYYYAASPRSRAVVARRTSELATRCEALGLPTFACEMGAGFPPFFPPLDEGDSAFTLLCAMAYGLRGFNLYMAVERDRWIGAPIDPRGRARPFATFFRKLCAALDATDFASLHRRVPVRLVLPRSERRLRRVMHAFGPLSGAIFSVLGAGGRESCLEDHLGLDYPLAIEADRFAHAVEEGLDARGVPHAYLGGEDRDVSLRGARWIICATSGGMHPLLAARLMELARDGTRVTVGPREVRFDGAMRPLPEPLTSAFDAAGVRMLLVDDPAAIDATIADAISELPLPTLACDPERIFATVHEDDSGLPKVLFVINPSDTDVVARLTPPRASDGSTARRATDVLDGTSFDAHRRGTLEVRTAPRSVRMLALQH